MNCACFKSSLRSSLEMLSIILWLMVQTSQNHCKPFCWWINHERQLKFWWQKNIFNHIHQHSIFHPRFHPCVFHICWWWTFPALNGSWRLSACKTAGRISRATPGCGAAGGGTPMELPAVSRPFLPKQRWDGGEINQVTPTSWEVEKI